MADTLVEAALTMTALAGKHSDLWTGEDYQQYRESARAIFQSDHLRVEMAERMRKALMEAHADEWDMETVAEAAHICAAVAVGGLGVADE